MKDYSARLLPALSAIAAVAMVIACATDSADAGAQGAGIGTAGNDGQGLVCLWPDNEPPPQQYVLPSYEGTTAGLCDPAENVGCFGRACNTRVGARMLCGPVGALDGGLAVAVPPPKRPVA